MGYLMGWGITPLTPHVVFWDVFDVLLCWCLRWISTIVDIPSEYNWEKKKTCLTTLSCFDLAVTSR